MDLKRVISEIQRRHVGRVAGVYAVVGWVVIQVVATVFPLLGLPESSAKVVVVLIIIGFPLAIALAWAFDFTPTGIQRTEALPAGAPAFKPDEHHYRRALGFFGIGILVSLVAFAALSHVRDPKTASGGAAGVHSIGVLPFVDMSEKHDQAYFTDGISEEILNRLAQIEDLRVPARTSSFAFRSSNLGIAEIGQKLNVDAVLEGSVRRDRDSVRVTVRLIDAKAQKPLWSKEYQKQISSIFAIQDEIATDIVSALQLQINPQPVKTTNALADVKAQPEAVDAYMKGLALYNRRTDATMRRAITYFESAVEKDPQFAVGWAYLAQSYALLPAYGDFPAFEASTKGQAAAARALQLNPSLPEAYAALGQIRQNFEWDFESAERSYRRAILFNNGYATAHQWRAEVLLFLGKYAESQGEIESALDLDPAAPAALNVKAYQHVTRREFPLANRILDRILASNPEYPLALTLKASIAILTSPATANVAIDALTRATPELNTVLPAVAAAAANADKRAVALAELQKLDGRRSASELALWYALAGLQTEALGKIRKAYESGADVNLPFILLHPAFDSIRSNKDYQSILNELHMAAE